MTFHDTALEWFLMTVFAAVRLCLPFDAPWRIWAYIYVGILCAIMAGWAATDSVRVRR